MNYFEHSTGAGDDSDFHNFLTKCGNIAEGYYIFFRTLELMGKEFDINMPGRSTFNRKFMRNRISKSWHKIEKVLKLADKMLPKDKGIFVTFDGESVRLNCPRLKRIADNYTKKMIRRQKEKERPLDVQKPAIGQTDPPPLDGQGTATGAPQRQIQKQTTELELDMFVTGKGIDVEKSDIFNSSLLLSFVGVEGMDATRLSKEHDTKTIHKAVSYAIRKSKKNPAGMTIRALEKRWKI